MDHIEIKGLEVFGNHGVLPEENQLGQKFIVHADMELDTHQAGVSDALEDSVAYDQVADLIYTETKRNTFQLLERLADHLAKQILLTFPAVKGVTLEVEKPWAPIHLHLQTVAVKIHRGWHRVALSIGSNMGDKRANLDRALELLSQDEQNQVLKVSEYIVTVPVGGVEQDDFLNGAVLLDTIKTPEEMLSQIGDIEKELKRVRTVHWGPRTIDLDILLYDQAIISTDDLIIPHPEMCKRRFVLEPLDQIAPYLVHPIYSKTIHDLLLNLGIVR